jgi:hypothetical protein
MTEPGEEAWVVVFHAGTPDSQLKAELASYRECLEYLALELDGWHELEELSVDIHQVIEKKHTS